MAILKRSSIEMAALAAVTLAACGTGLWLRGQVFRIAFVTLVLGWWPIDQPIAIVFATATLMLACRHAIAVNGYVVGLPFLQRLIVFTDIREVVSSIATIVNLPLGVYRNVSLVWNPDIFWLGIGESGASYSSIRSTYLRINSYVDRSEA